VLLIDNYDSYTYNLYHLIGGITGEPPVVVRNDDLPTVDEIKSTFDHIVISPGPGHPADRRRTGGCVALVRAAPVPVLGVCLGHQAIALAFGGVVAEVPPRHGHISRVRHDDRGVLRGVPQHFAVVRYHSLAVTAVPEELELTGFADDGTVMALRHRSLPLHGIQFHPESVCAEYGSRIVSNFLGAGAGAPGRRAAAAVSAVTATRQRPKPPSFELVTRQAPWRDPEDVFASAYAGRRYACWLDSGGPYGGLANGLANWSYMGAPEGPRAHVVHYRAADNRVYVTTGDRTTAERGDIFEFLRRRQARPRVPPDQPFDFAGGYVGYLGYELKRCWGATTRHRASTHDAALAYLERFIAFDHANRRTFAVAVAAPGERAAGQAWVDRTARAVHAIRPAVPPAYDAGRTDVVAGMTHDRYLTAFERVRRYLHRGDTYEVNLTFRLMFGCTADHAELYRHLRRSNPAPFAAFLRLPGVCVLSSSPERFLRIDGFGTVEARPIKGTARRLSDLAADATASRRLASDPKTFAENLMVTDLLRNDLGQVCELGRVEVPRLMEVESYATVHQLVTTVSGVLKAETDPVSCVRSAFPGGSMTGAPKLRTMEIIDEIETDARGVYSGALGYFSLSGTVDLSIVIRTIVARGTSMSIGTGGGVVAMSDADDEYAEAMLKASALLDAVSRACGRRDG
jgi:para-aminobenzoate synthetase